MHRPFALLLLSTLVAPVPGQDTEDPNHVESTERFAFHSSPWLNLHHMLYQWARGLAPRADGDRRPPVEVRETAQLEGWSAEERSSWQAAVDHYAESIVARSLTFNGELYQLKRELLSAGETIPDDLPYRASPVLRAAMPIYREHFWRAHDARNRRWVTEVLPQLKEHEAAAGERIARAMGGAWPDEPMRVDLCFYANWAGAYTTRAPDHVVIASDDSDIQGWAAFELLLHEPCHSAALGLRFGQRVSAAFRAEGVDEPDRLWHQLIFYSAGEITRDVVPEPDLEQFRTYAETAGFWTRPQWRGLERILDAHWRPFLDETVEQEEALRAVARAWGER